MANHASSEAMDDSGIHADFIPADRYADSLAVLERDRLWPRIWHIVCRAEELPRQGDFLTYEIGDESIIIARVSASEIKAFYNACQHRGRQLVDRPKGHLAGFYCRFHGWSYRLDGSVAQVNREQEWADCPRFHAADLGLKSPRIGQWAGWVWIAMDDDAPSLEEWLGEPLMRIMGPFDLQDLRIAWHERIHAPVNWKVVIEAFNEGYHSGATHNQRIDYNVMHSPGVIHGRHGMYFTTFNGLPKLKREDGTWSTATSIQDMLYYQSKELNETLFALAPDTAMRAMARLREETGPEMAPEAIFAALWRLQREEIEATGARWPERLTPEHVAEAGTSWHLFPNTIFLPVPDGVLWYRMLPDGGDPRRCVFDIWGLGRFAPGREPLVETRVSLGFEEARGRNPFLEQDFDNMVAVDRGMRSRGWIGARTNPAEENLIVNFHRQLDLYLADQRPAG